jgi:hypothetical protein
MVLLLVVTLQVMIWSYLKALCLDVTAKLSTSLLDMTPKEHLEIMRVLIFILEILVLRLERSLW